MNAYFSNPLGRKLAQRARQDEFSGVAMARQDEANLQCTYGYANRICKV